MINENKISYQTCQIKDFSEANAFASQANAFASQANIFYFPQIKQMDLLLKQIQS